MSARSRFTFWSVLLCGCLTCGSVFARDLEFNFKDPKGVNSVLFVLDSMLEPIMGLATGISGKIKFKPADPKKISGRLVIDAKSVRCSLPAMTSVMHSKDWLDVKSHPTIEFVFKSVQSVSSQDDNVTEMMVVGDFECKGVTKEMVVPIKITFLRGQLKKRMRRGKGDLLVLRSAFTIKRSDFGIKPDMGPDTVAEDIEVRISIVGAARRK